MRQLFWRSRLIEFHVDGFRSTPTQAIHRDNTINLEHGWGVLTPTVRPKPFREWSRTLRLLKPAVMLIAEYSDWPKVTEDPRVGGLGFDATYLAEFYHHLSGRRDGRRRGAAASRGRARL